MAAAYLVGLLEAVEVIVILRRGRLAAEQYAAHDMHVKRKAAGRQNLRKWHLTGEIRLKGCRKFGTGSRR